MQFSTTIAVDEHKVSLEPASMLHREFQLLVQLLLGRYNITVDSFLLMMCWNICHKIK